MLLYSEAWSLAVIVCLLECCSMCAFLTTGGGGCCTPGRVLGEDLAQCCLLCTQYQTNVNRDCAQGRNPRQSDVPLNANAWFGRCPQVDPIPCCAIHCGIVVAASSFVTTQCERSAHHVLCPGSRLAFALQTIVCAIPGPRISSLRRARL